MQTTFENEPHVDELGLDEPLWRLCEIDYPDLIAGLRRLQMVWVVKGQEPVLYLKDLGPASNFLAPPCEIVSGIERTTGSWGVLTVGEGLRQAEALRNFKETDMGLEFAASLMSFEDEWQQALENTRSIESHRSVSGPMYSKVRA